MTAFELPGHFPGHMGLRIESDGRRAILLADAAVNPSARRPELVYVSDADSERAHRRGANSSTELVDQDILAVCGHYPGGGIGRVVTRDGRVVWEAA